MEYTNFHRPLSYYLLVSPGGTEMQVNEGRPRHYNLSFVTPILPLNHIYISKHFEPIASPTILNW